jgi:hypothetical protein
MGWFTPLGGHVTACNSSSTYISFFKNACPLFFPPQDYLVKGYVLGIQGRKLKIKNPTPANLCMTNPLATSFAE